ncbi:MAG: winged helix-turn-helix transcriptional regulator [Rhodobacterales bacterium]|nr:winged helix-turn-helix transcriptional regulator [Rhodobacterales bacterium]
MFDIERLKANAAGATDLLKILSNPIRLKTLCSLAEGEMNVGELVQRTGAKQSCLSQHLSRLRDGGVVTTRRDGHLVFYSLSDPAMGQLVGVLREIYCPLEVTTKGLPRAA